MAHEGHVLISIFGLSEPHPKPGATFFIVDDLGVDKYSQNEKEETKQMWNLKTLPFQCQGKTPDKECTDGVEHFSGGKNR